MAAPADAAEPELFAKYPDLMTPADIAAETGFNVSYVRKLFREQRLPAVQIRARQWFVPKPRFIEFVNGGGLV